MNLRQHLDHLFVITVMLLMSSAFISHLVDLSTSDSAGRGSGTMQAIWFAVYLLILVRVLPHWRTTVLVLRANFAFTLFASLSVVSLVWAADPSETLRHGVAFAFSTLFGVDFAQRYTLREQVGLITATLWFAILLSCVVELAFPSFVIPATFGQTNIVDVDAWIGIYHQKNIFGHVLALAGVLALSRFTWEGKSIVWNGAALLLCCVVIEKAKSQTALVVIFSTGFLLFCLLTLRFRRRTLSTLGAATGLLAFAFAVSAIFYRDELAAMVGRSSNLTGRTGIWALVFDSMAKRPMLGYGFSGFWMSSYDSLRINDLLGWTVPSSHNIYIDIGLQIGALGLGIFFVAYGTAIVRAVAAMRATVGAEGRWPLAYLLMATVYGCSESDLYYANSLYWVLFTAACITATRYAPVHARPQWTPGRSPARADHSALQT